MANTLRIKEAIKEHGLTCLEVATRLGMTKMALSRMINENPTWKKIEEIANAAGCNPIDFMPIPPEGYKPSWAKSEEPRPTEQTYHCPACGTTLKLLRDA